MRGDLGARSGPRDRLGPRSRTRDSAPCGSRKTRIVLRLVRLAAALCAGLSPAALRAQVDALPPEHWAYDEIEHFEARGFLALSAVRPYTRGEMRRRVEELVAKREAEPVFSRVELARLSRLEDEFVHGADLAESARRFDPPLVRLGEAGWRFGADAELATGGAGAVGSGTGPESDGTAWGLTHFEGLLRYRERAAYETRYRLVLQEEEGARTGENFVSPRERNWHGLTSHYDRAYVAAGGPRLRVVLGREYLGWGSRRGDELLVSDAGLSLDALQLHFELGRFRLASAAALLAAAENRHFAAHRLEIDLGAVRLGLQEAVVYVSPHLEPTYLFPLSFYYGNQFNERSDDNVLLGCDARWRSPVGILDVELLVDDFIYDGDPAPNKLGVRLGWRRGFAVAGTDLDLELAYTALGRWTYTHRDTGNAYVSESGDPAAGDPYLGHPLGPDADRWQASAVWWPGARWRLGLGVARTRRGEGNLDPRAWQSGSPYDVPFPSGAVRTDDLVGVSARYLLGRRLALGAAAEYAAASGSRAARFLAEARLDL